MGRDEIKREAKKVCKWIPGNLHDIPAWEMRHESCKRCEKIEQAILAQVKKARAEALEEAAKIAEDHHWEIKWRGEPKTKTKAGITGEDIARQIRNKLEKE